LRIVGIDVNSRIIEYALLQAEEQQVAGRVEFLVADALRVLDFPEDSFDLVNQRLGSSYLRTWDWSKLLNEFQRVLRPNGIIRITEPSIVKNNSSALTRLNDILLQTMYLSGHLFSSNSYGIHGDIVQIMQRQGIRNIQTHAYTLEYRGGTVSGQSYSEYVKYMFRIFQPFFQKWSRITENYGMLYQQALEDIQKPDFLATLTLLTIWGDRRNSASYI
jgi:ubiquinone/menaquinone biosynthesis C-methylase UbiE